MDSRGRMQNENEDDIDVLSNGDTQNIIDDPIEQLIDIRSAQRQQLFYSNAGNLEDNAASLHSLKLSYDALKKRYNELEIKNQTMQKVITEIESERLGKDRLNPRVSLTGCDAAGPAASVSPDAGTAEGSMANVRAHLGYAQRLERQILRLQMTMEEQTQKFRKSMENLHNEKEFLQKNIIEKDEEIKKLKQKSVESGPSKPQHSYEKEIGDLKVENAKLVKELEAKEERMMSILQKQQKLSPSLYQGSVENESIMMIDNGKILGKIRDQNKIIQGLQQQITEQRRMIENQTEIVKKVVKMAKESGVSLSSSFQDLSRRIDGSSMPGSYKDPQVAGPCSPRSPKSSYDQLQNQTHTASQFSHSHYSKSAISSSSSTNRNMSAPTLQSDYHDGNIPQSSIMSKISRPDGNSASLMRPLQDGISPIQTGARPKVGSSPRNLEFSPIVDDFSMNQNQAKQVELRKNPNVNVQSYETVPTTVTGINNQNNMFAPNLLRQGETTSKQPQQNTEIVDSNKVRMFRTDAQIHNNLAGKPIPYTGNAPPEISVSPHRIENSLPTSSDNLFGGNGQRLDGKPFKIPQQNEDLLFNAPDQIVEDDYVNVWSNSDMPNRRVSQETGGQGSTVNRCPVCSQEFPGMDMQEFQMHVLHCIDDSSDEPRTIQNPNPVDSNNRICPMCDAVFPSELPQEEYENHVQEHFGEERFEVLQT